MKARILKYNMVLLLLLIAAIAYSQPRKPGGGSKPRTSKKQKTSFLDRITGKVRKMQKRSEMKRMNREITNFTVKTDFSKAKRYVIFGASMGASNYFGDLAPRSRRASSDLKLTRSAMSAFAGYRVHPNIVLSGSISWFRIRGDDVSSDPNDSEDGWGRYVRGLSFRNDIKELAGYATFDLIPTDRGYIRRNVLVPYAFLGLSIFHHNPKARLPTNDPGKLGDWVDLQPLGTEGQFTGRRGYSKPYSRIQLAVPVGVGVRYRLADKFDLGLNFGYRVLFTDYIDDVSTQYPEEEVYDEMYRRNPLSVVMSNRSAETYAAATGEKRSWSDLSPPEVFYSNNGFEAMRVPGNQFGGAPRGNKRRDYIVTTTISLAYMFDIKQRPPRFR